VGDSYLPKPGDFTLPVTRVTVPATAKAKDIAANYAGNKHFRLVKLTTYGGELIHNFERSRQRNKGRER